MSNRIKNHMGLVKNYLWEKIPLFAHEDAEQSLIIALWKAIQKKDNGDPRDLQFIFYWKARGIMGEDFRVEAKSRGVKSRDLYKNDAAEFVNIPFDEEEIPRNNDILTNLILSEHLEWLSKEQLQIIEGYSLGLNHHEIAKKYKFTSNKTVDRQTGHIKNIIHGIPPVYLGGSILKTIAEKRNCSRRHAERHLKKACAAMGISREKGKHYNILNVQQIFNWIDSTKDFDNKKGITIQNRIASDQDPVFPARDCRKKP